MIFNETVIGDHPASDGYIVECRVRGSETAENSDGSDFFDSGSGRLKIEFPEFAITGLEFEGKNLLFEPTGSTPDEQFFDNIDILEANINLKAFFSGDLNGATGLAIQNIKNVDVYTGFDVNFQVDSLNHKNRISQFPVSLSSGEPFFLVNVVDTEITGADENPLVEENIFYKVIPTDYLTFGKESPSISGVMFSGFSDFTRINVDPFVITRSNGNDVLVGYDRSEPSEIFTGTNIVIDDSIPLDFYGTFKINTTEEITISGSGIPLVSSSADLTVDSENKITIPANNQSVEFEIDCLLNESDVRTGYAVEII